MFRLVILRLLESYFRRRWLNLVPIVLFGILGIIYVLTRPPSYQASGVILVQEDTVLNSLTAIRETGYVWITPAEATMAQIGELAQTASFLRAVVQQTPLEAQIEADPTALIDVLEEAQESLGVTAQGDNQLSIGATHENPDVAFALVNGTIDSFLQFHIGLARSGGSTAADFFGERVTQYKSDLDSARDELEAYLQAHPEPVRGQRPAIEELAIEGLQGNIDIVATNYVHALNQFEQARLALSQAEADVTQSYQVIDEPLYPESALGSKADMIFGVALFSVIGVLFTVVSIVGGAVLDRSLRFPIDVQQAIELPVLALVPTGESYAAEETFLDIVMPEPDPEPEFPHRRARLIPLVEPPTLVILPDEAHQIDPIRQERQRHEYEAQQYRQERNHANGFSTRNVGSDFNPDDFPTTILGGGRRR